MSGYKKFMNKIHEKEKRVIALMQAGASEVGIFFIIGNEIILASMPTEESSDNGELNYLSYSHEHFWRNIKKCLSEEVKNKNFDEIERGSVSFDKKTSHYLVRGSSIILNEEVQNLIRMKFKLPESVIFEVELNRTINDFNKGRE